MKTLGKKLELEALSNKHFGFITQEYLPKKLAHKRWLE
jgi:DNA topoisomerase VI subunit A